MKKLMLALGFLRLWKSWQGKFGFAISSGIASLLLAPLLVLLPMEASAQSDAQSGSGPDSSTPIPVQVPDSSPNNSSDSLPSESEPSLLDQLRDAQPAEITGVRLEVLEDGLKVVLETEQPERVEVFQFQEGTTLIVDVTNAVLALPEGESYQQLNPVPGVTSLTLEQRRSDEVQITAISDNEAPPVAYFERVLEGVQLDVVTIVPGADDANIDFGSSNLRIIVVAEPPESFRVQQASTGTRTNTELIDVPQGIQVIPQAVLEEQGSTTLSDTLRNVSGASAGRASTGLQATTPIIRGFESNNV